ncbi:TrkA C-terminal domain-containing protein [Skermania sp. ID1734]|uniref:TrkA C-terminal domain-containing protein n=1 Tax=Skermania sp. ID1734 TaxID=2597516 RepID=UPI00351BA482
MANRLNRAMPLLQGVAVADAMVPPRLVLAADLPLTEAMHRLESESVPGAPVVDADGRFVGTVARIGRSDPDGHYCVLDFVDRAAVTVPPDASVDLAIEALVPERHWLPVVDAQRHVRGVIGLREVVAAYRRAVQQEIGRFATVAADVEIADVVVAAESPLVGSALGDGQLPDGVIVAGVLREDTSLPPSAATTLAADDVLTLLGRRAELDAVAALLTAP